MRAEERKPPGNRKTESRVFDADLAQEAVAGSGWAKHTPVDIHVLMKIRKLRVFFACGSRKFRVFSLTKPQLLPPRPDGNHMNDI